MIEYQEIRHVHLEVSTLCNASCPWCPRNFWGYPHNDGYPEINLSLSQAQHIFSAEFIAQLELILINGNFGDMVMNPNSADIVEYFRSHNKNLLIKISTNGGARDAKFWRRLAHAGITVLFALDGLEDTHSLYRQNTVWATVIKNAKTFIAHGGNAVWKMIRFQHNQHQIDACQKLSAEMGFSGFELVNHGRDTAPVFDNQGKLTHVLGSYQGETSFPVLWHSRKTDQVLVEDVVGDRVPKNKIDCLTKKFKSIYIAANGAVSPCCFTGYYPNTFGHGYYWQAANSQLQPLVTNNNALEYSLQECIQWFHNVESSWQHNDYNHGRLIVCDDNCGYNSSKSCCNTEALLDQ
jgi:MoaA/NifB/PqqE/SkfB family radical SAM enzyme